ncbi:hypothetical protein [Gloeobacter violaceus]|uniref:hypothetical protein n=1 Tax=Gloeobacter violaceus TaxID=33072 RepID=UPI0013E8D94E|nr:hypothetical protein [Gloeobacter violaceus]
MEISVGNQQVDYSQDPDLVIDFFFESACSQPMARRSSAASLYDAAELLLKEAANEQVKAKTLYESIRGLSVVHCTPEEQKTIRNYLSFSSVGFFLVALALENLLKELVLLKELAMRKKDSNSGGSDINHHDLKKLAKTAKMDLSSEEENLLKDMEQLTTWYGRYPIPRKPEDYKKYFKNGPPTNRFLKEEDVFSLELPFPSELEQFFDRVLKEIDREAPGDGGLDTQQ